MIGWSCNVRSKVCFLKIGGSDDFLEPIRADLQLHFVYTHRRKLGNNLHRVPPLHLYHGCRWTFFILVFE